MTNANELKGLLQIHKNNLAKLQSHAAKYNVVPSYLSDQIENEWKEIRRIEAELRRR